MSKAGCRPPVSSPIITSSPNFSISNNLISSKLMAPGVLFSSFCYQSFYIQYGRAGGWGGPAKIQSIVVLKYSHPKMMVLALPFLHILLPVRSIFFPVLHGRQFPGFAAKPQRLSGCLSGANENIFQIVPCLIFQSCLQYAPGAPASPQKKVKAPKWVFGDLFSFAA